MGGDGLRQAGKPRPRCEYVVTRDELKEAVKGIHRLGKFDSSWWLHEQALEIAKASDMDIPLAIEVGTWTGGTAIPMALAGMRVLCVDTFRMSDPYVGPEMDALRGWYGQPKIQHTLGVFMDHIIKFDLQDKIMAFVGTSKQAHELLTPNLANLIFIDADHRENSVRDDLMYWEPILKPGGLFCGHDFRSVKGIFSVVTTWTKAHGWPRAQDGPDNIWWTRKPE